MGEFLQRNRFSNFAAVSMMLFCVVLGSGPRTSFAQTRANGDARNSGNSNITFNNHVAPIIHTKCSGCHRPGQAGPFPLLTYQDVAKRARTIEAVIDSGYMPPWKPVDGDFEYSHDRSLSKAQKKIIQQWIKSGRRKGTGSEPAPPKFKDGWRLGKPDHVVKMNGQFRVPASGPDIYRSFVFPLQFSEDKWVKAIEYRPTATSAVHHGIFFVDQNGAARALDGKDGKPGIAGMSFLASDLVGGSAGRQKRDVRQLFDRKRNRQGSGSENPSGLDALNGGLGGYVPGSTPAKLPGDLALRLPAGSDIVMQTHFHPSGRAEVEAGQLAIYFAEKKPSKTLVNIQIPAAFGIGVGLKIPAGKKDLTISESYRLPADIQLVSVTAHAHYLCRHASMIARLPNGKTKVLLKIDDWDLDWQDRYYFKNQVLLPAGTVLTSKLVYDNSADNPENPNSPPREVRWGRESGDEMGSLTVHAVAANENEYSRLKTSISQYMIQSVMQGDFVELLMQLDTNRDGGLQPSEAPPRMQQRFKMLDRNGDQKLDRKELELLRRFLPKKGK